MDKLDEISRQRKKAHQKLVSLKSKVYETFLQMEQATYADGALPKKTKELIAIGISVQMDCESCMQWHIDQAAACGATLREILEAIEVGIEMGAGCGWLSNAKDRRQNDPGYYRQPVGGGPGQRLGHRIHPPVFQE